MSYGASNVELWNLVKSLTVMLSYTRPIPSIAVAILKENTIIYCCQPSKNLMHWKKEDKYVPFDNKKVFSLLVDIVHLYSDNTVPPNMKIE